MALLLWPMTEPFLYIKEMLKNNYGYSEALIIGRKWLYPNNFYKRNRLVTDKD